MKRFKYTKKEKRNMKRSIIITLLILTVLLISCQQTRSFDEVETRGGSQENNIRIESPSGNGAQRPTGSQRPIRQGDLSVSECRERALDELVKTCPPSMLNGLEDLIPIPSQKTTSTLSITKDDCIDFTKRMFKKYCEEEFVPPTETEPPVTDDDPYLGNAGGVNLGEATEISCDDEACSRGYCTKGEYECMQLEVVCDGIDNEDAIVRISGDGSAGTVVLYTGGVGMGLFGLPYPTSNGEPAEEALDLYMNTLRDKGFQLVEVGWESPGPWGIENKGDAGSRTLACRPATAMFWIYNNLHEGGLFAAQGNSGGSSQTAFSLTYYGADEILDVVNLGGGPPLCPIIIDGRTNGAENDEYCHQGPEGNFGGLEFINEPLLSGDPLLNYPDTKVNVFVGENEPHEIAHEENNLYYHAVESDKTFTWLPNTWHPTHLTIEGATATSQAILDRYEELYG